MVDCAVCVGVHVVTRGCVSRCVVKSRFEDGVYDVFVDPEDACDPFLVERCECGVSEDGVVYDSRYTGHEREGCLERLDASYGEPVCDCGPIVSVIV